ncbi:hypothetical protein C4588_05725 [Candidatus Parcubacteria bacterium]|nr:MAG: hypothetical protein C4588_05725 [Candidatus Parcubacteria bacterium]
MTHIRVIGLWDIASGIFNTLVGLLLWVLMGASITLPGKEASFDDVKVFLMVIAPFGIYYSIWGLFCVILGVSLLFRSNISRWVHLVTAFFLLVSVPVGVIACIIVLIPLLLLFSPIFLGQVLYSAYCIYLFLFNKDVISCFRRF